MKNILQILNYQSLLSLAWHDICIIKGFKFKILYGGMVL